MHRFGAKNAYRVWDTTRLGPKTPIARAPSDRPGTTESTASIEAEVPTFCHMLVASKLSLDVQTRQTDGGVAVIVPSGRLDVAGAPALKDAISQLAKNGPPKVVIDMEGISFVDSTGLGSVIAALKEIRSSQGELRLAAPNQQVRVVLELTTLDRVFPYYATVEEALTGF